MQVRKEISQPKTTASRAESLLGKLSPGWILQWICNAKSRRTFICEGFE